MALWLQVKRHVPWEELIKLCKSAKRADLARKYLAILKMYGGKTVLRAVRELYVTSQVVRKWVHRWNECGPDGLKTRTRSGRPPILKPKERLELVEEITSFLRELGYDFSTWTLKAVIGHVKRKHGKEISVSGACYMLKKCCITRVVPKPLLGRANPKKTRVLAIKDQIDQELGSVGFDPHPRREFFLPEQNSPQDACLEGQAPDLAHIRPKEAHERHRSHRPAKQSESFCSHQEVGRTLI